MKPESNGLASGGAETSLGSCATAGLVVTECNEAALLIHSTVSPFWIVTVRGTNLGGVSVILTSTVLAAAIDGTAPATKISEPQTVNLLALIDVARDAIPSSQWEKKGADLIGRGGTKDGILEVTQPQGRRIHRKLDSAIQDGPSC